VKHVAHVVEGKSMIVQQNLAHHQVLQFQTFLKLQLQCLLHYHQLVLQYHLIQLQCQHNHRQLNPHYRILQLQCPHSYHQVNPQDHLRIPQQRHQQPIITNATTLQIIGMTLMVKTLIALGTNKETTANSLGIRIKILGKLRTKPVAAVGEVRNQCAKILKIGMMLVERSTIVLGIKNLIGVNFMGISLKTLATQLIKLAVLAKDSSK